MKKFLAIVLSLSMILVGVSCGMNQTGEEPTYKIAVITDCGGVDDQSFNQNTYEGAKEFCENNGIDYTYFEPAEDSSNARLEAVNEAINGGYNVLILTGYEFGEIIPQVAEQNQQVKFIAIDVSQEDLGGGYTLPQNVYCANYKEELAGFMAGYAAVKLGYKQLGFLGGKSYPAVIRYGYGFVQGADFAAQEDKVKGVKVNFAYANTFDASDEITKYVDKWYKKGTEVVFSCGGGIYTSVAEAAKKHNAKVIGVDVDQSAAINEYGKDMAVTSAMKGLGETVKVALNILVVNATWSEYSGQVLRLGLVSDKNPDENFVQLPLETTQWSDSFTEDNYKDLVKRMYSDEIQVSSDTNQAPTVKKIKVDYMGSL